MERSIGQRLAQARRTRGLDVLDVAHRTRIRPDLVRHLEADDFEVFPGPAYARSFQRLYARYLGVEIEGDRFAGTIGRCHDPISEVPLAESPQPGLGLDDEGCDDTHPLSAPGLATAASGVILGATSRVRPAAGVLATSIIALLVIPFAYVRFAADARDRGALHAVVSPEALPALPASGTPPPGGAVPTDAEANPAASGDAVPPSPVYPLSAIVSRSEPHHPELAALREQELGVIIDELSVAPEPEVQPEPTVVAAPPRAVRSAPPRVAQSRPRPAQPPPPRARPVERGEKRGFLERLFGRRR